MITMKEFLDAIGYRITEGSRYCWDCFGPNARYLDSTDDHYSASAIFDAETQEIYRVEITDNVKDLAYRLTNPAYEKAVKDEAKRRDVDDSVAWDDVRWTDLEVKEDWMEKAHAIMTGEEYDERVSVPLDLPDDVLLTLMKMAHERDITFNSLMEEVLKDAIDRVKRDNPNWDQA